VENKKKNPKKQHTIEEGEQRREKNPTKKLDTGDKETSRVSTIFPEAHPASHTGRGE